MAQQHVVFVNIGAAGHMNPTLPVVSELCRMPAFMGRGRISESSLRSALLEVFWYQLISLVTIVESAVKSGQRSAK